MYVYFEKLIFFIAGNVSTKISHVFGTKSLDIFPLYSQENFEIAVGKFQE